VIATAVARATVDQGPRIRCQVDLRVSQSTCFKGQSRSPFRGNFAQTWARRLVPITCGDWDGKARRSNVVTIDGRLMVILALARSDYSHSHDRWRY
jgi:hypothetical protein